MRKKKFNQLIQALFEINVILEWTLGGKDISNGKTKYGK
jgi:hypothetical protein